MNNEQNLFIMKEYVILFEKMKSTFLLDYYKLYRNTLTVTGYKTTKTGTTSCTIF